MKTQPFTISTNSNKCCQTKQKMTKPAHHDMPGNRDAMPHAETGAETQAMRLHAWCASDAGMPSSVCTGPQLTVTHVVNASKFIHAPLLSQILHWLTTNERIKYNIHLYVLWSSNSVLWSSCKPSKMSNAIYRYNVLELKKTCSFQCFPVVI